ncbi:peptidase inhibitor family I36 protein [Kribbella sandramycini]|uniref:Peptidase inhibitor family I36 protein n=1 Tax=Kribbella sandramycini TaxID=60450 RepID=A0A7Y4L0E8_9ACTN|nr:peptidase inhibitor family I36 protein [Kribbella sandramycini]MBB6569132.1 hypothetical protein [Kribbella sandramycini]NOL41026.1 peptidase inhibitor family I36 protein [Kribbella sandramycini]
MSKIVKLTAGLGLVVGGMVATTVPASAAWGECSISYLCLWGNSNWDGGPWFEKKELGKYNTGWSNNDESSSAANRSGVASFMLYDKTNSQSDGGVACLPRNYSSRRLGDEGWGDRISSMRIQSGACPDDVDYVGSPKTS